MSSNTERQRYDEAWATGEYDPLVGLTNIRKFYKAGWFGQYRKVLDVGCGMGATVRYLREIGGYDAYGIDFASPAIATWKQFEVDKYCCVASADEMPFANDEFDLVLCMDMMEHVPEADVPDVLREIARVGSRDFLWVIALTEAKVKMPDGSEPHICVKPPRWWADQVSGVGLQTPKHIPYYAHAMCIKARKPSRLILPYAYKH